MAKQISAGLLIYRHVPHLEVLIAHPGGPFFARKDAGSWTIPKGEIEAGERALAAAYREFSEETGLQPPAGEPISLDEVVQRSGKVVQAWALAGDLDLAGFVSNTFSMVWPTRSGVMREFPEIDRVQWVTAETASAKLLPAQVPFVDRLRDYLASVN